MNHIDLDDEVKKAIQYFWNSRSKQGMKQGASTGLKDQGYRSEVTGGGQMDGFVDLITFLLCQYGLNKSDIHTKKGHTDIPGWFRSEKQWDVLVINDKILIAAIELKSHIGPSFSNNINNRTEEALGNSMDFLSAYREGAFSPATRPWLGYLMLLEDSEKSTRPVKVRESHFQTFDEFRTQIVDGKRLKYGSTYEDRYIVLCTKLMRERLYDSTCLLMSNRTKGLNGDYREPSSELCFVNFASSLISRVIAFTRMR